MLVQTTSHRECLVLVGWFGWVFWVLVWFSFGFFDKWKEAGTALPIESNNPWQPRTMDTWHTLPSMHGTMQNNSFITHPKGRANTPRPCAKMGLWWRALTCCQLPNPPSAQPSFKLKQFHKHTNDLWENQEAISKVVNSHQAVHTPGWTQGYHECFWVTAYPITHAGTPTTCVQSLCYFYWLVWCPWDRREISVAKP